MLRRLPFVPLDYSMRSRFVYQNVMYATAGHVESLESGTSWDELLRRRIFLPLGMKESYTSTHQLPTAPNVATPHAWVNDTLVTVPWRNLDAIAPAGSVNSSVSDMARWIRVVLDSGRVRNASGAVTTRLVSAATFAELFKPQTIVPTDFYPAWTEVKPHAVTYGLGWFLFDYHGHRVAMHTGSIDGMSAIVGLLPDDRVGVVVLANQDHAELRHALLLRAFDMYLGQAGRDWSTDLHQLYTKLQKQGDSARAAGAPPHVAGAGDSSRLIATPASIPTACTADSRSDWSKGNSSRSTGPGSPMSNPGAMTRSVFAGVSGRTASSSSPQSSLPRGPSPNSDSRTVAPTRAPSRSNSA